MLSRHQKKTMISLFTKHLHQILQENNADHLYGVCDLLCSHLGVFLIVKDLGGETFFEKKASPPNPLFKKTFTFGDGDRYVLEMGRGVEFGEEDFLVVEVALCVLVVLIRFREIAYIEDRKRRIGAVRVVINSLSFSELDVATDMIRIVAENENNEGLLVAGHIADRLGLTRSVVTSTLRKLEGASLLETRSLGMKGTYIKIKDTLLIDELGKL